MPIFYLMVFGLMVFGAIVIFSWYLEIKRNAHLGNSSTQCKIPRTPLERKKIDEAYIFENFGFPVGLLSDIIMSARGTCTPTFNERFFHGAEQLRENSKCGIYRRGHLQPNNIVHAVVKSGSIVVDLTITSNPKNRRDIAVSGLNGPDLHTLELLYNLWMNYDICRLGILGFFYNLYNDLEYTKLVGGQIGLTDYAGGLDIGACWWTYEFDAVKNINVYDISYLGKHYTVWISPSDRRFQIDDDIVTISEFKQSIKELI